MSRPLYCPCKYETPDPCPECGATVSGKDLVRGVCQALRGLKAEPLVLFVTVTKGSPADPAYMETPKE